jgi:hypothetical protein
MNGEQYNQLNNELLQGFNREKAEAQKYRRRVAGVPDVQSVFASADEEHLIEKDKVLEQMTDRLADEFRAKPENQGKLVPWQALTEQAIDQYDKVVKPKLEHEKAEGKLAKFAEELVAQGLVTSDFAFTSTTNIEDLIERKILTKEADITFVRKEINKLKKVGTP